MAADSLPAAGPALTGAVAAWLVYMALAPGTRTGCRTPINGGDASGEASAPAGEAAAVGGESRRGPPAAMEEARAGAQATVAGQGAAEMHDEDEQGLPEDEGEESEESERNFTSSSETEPDGALVETLRREDGLQEALAARRIGGSRGRTAGHGYPLSTISRPWAIDGRGRTREIPLFSKKADAATQTEQGYRQPWPPGRSSLALLEASDQVRYAEELALLVHGRPGYLDPDEERHALWKLARYHYNNVFRRWVQQGMVQEGRPLPTDEEVVQASATTIPTRSEQKRLAGEAYDKAHETMVAAREHGLAGIRRMLEMYSGTIRYADVEELLSLYAADLVLRPSGHGCKRRWVTLREAEQSTVAAEPTGPPVSQAAEAAENLEKVAAAAASATVEDSLEARLQRQEETSTRAALQRMARAVEGIKMQAELEARQAAAVEQHRNRRRQEQEMELQPGLSKAPAAGTLAGGPTGAGAELVPSEARGSSKPEGLAAAVASATSTPSGAAEAATAVEASPHAGAVDRAPEKADAEEGDSGERWGKWTKEGAAPPPPNWSMQWPKEGRQERGRQRCGTRGAKGGGRRHERSMVALLRYGGRNQDYTFASTVREDDATVRGIGKWIPLQDVARECRTTAGEILDEIISPSDMVRRIALYIEQGPPRSVVWAGAFATDYEQPGHGKYGENRTALECYLKTPGQEAAVQIVEEDEIRHLAISILCEEAVDKEPRAHWAAPGRQGPAGQAQRWRQGQPAAVSSNAAGADHGAWKEPPLWDSKAGMGMAEEGLRPVEAAKKQRLESQARRHFSRPAGPLRSPSEEPPAGKAVERKSRSKKEKLGKHGQHRSKHKSDMRRHGVKKQEKDKKRKSRAKPSEGATHHKKDGGSKHGNKKEKNPRRKHRRSSSGSATSSSSGSDGSSSSSAGSS